MIRCLKCKKYFEVWGGKPPHTIQRFSNNGIYTNINNYDYLVIDEYTPYKLWDKFTNLFRRQKWVIVAGIMVSAESYATAYEDSTIEVVGLTGDPDSLSYQGKHFISHAKDFIANKQAFIDSIPVGRKIQCTSCQEVFELAEAVKFWEQGEQYYGDLPLCSCGGEIINDVESVKVSRLDGKPTDDDTIAVERLRTVFRCENCETEYNRHKFGDRVVDLADE